MPNKIKSSKQFRFLEGIAHGMKAKSGKGMPEHTAKKMLDKEDESKKKKFAKMKRA